MDEEIVKGIIAIVILVIFSGYFSATETAFTSLNKIKIKNMAADGNKRAKMVMKLSDNYDKLLSSILIGNNVVNIGMTAIATALFIRLVGKSGPTIATIVVTVIVLIFGEISPKSIAKELPERFSMFAAPFIRVMMVILAPLNFVFLHWKNMVTRIFKIRGDSNITEEELITIVEEAETVGSIHSDQSMLIQNAIEFNELTAEEVMTPRVDIEAIEVGADEDEVEKIFCQKGFSRVPVYEDDMDTIVGVLNQKDFHNFIRGGRSTIADHVKPVVFVAGTMRIAALLKRLQAIKSHIAIVVDEYGGTEGIVTMEDIIEELVGEIFDEHDAIMSNEVTQLGSGKYRVMCNASLSKVLDFFEINEEVDANTVNGWVVLCLGKLPDTGDKFEFVSEDRRFVGKVTKANGKKAMEIILTVEELPEDEDITN